MSHLSQKLTERTELAEAPASGDLLHVVDISDTTDSAEGTSKKVQAQYLTIADASATVKGKVELATDAETITGTDTVRAVTPSNITGKMDTDGTLSGNSDTRIPSQKAVKTYVDAQGGDTAAPNLLKNGNFINNSTNGYGSTPDDWTSSNANPVQGGIPGITKQQLIDITGLATADIELLCNLNGDFNDISDSATNLVAGGSPTDDSDGLMALAKKFVTASSQYASVTAPNTLVGGNQTWILLVKPTALPGTSSRYNLFGHSDAAYGVQAGLELVTDAASVSRFNFQLSGTTTNTQVTSDVIAQANKWYMIVGIFDSTNSLLKIWVNGIMKSVTASGTHTTTGTQTVGVGRAGSFAGNYSSALMNGAIMLSKALTNDQVKRLFAFTLYKGAKIRRVTTNGYIYQDLPTDLVERLRGKTVALRADIYQAVASTAQISILQTLADASTTETIISATDAITGSWLEKYATGTISATCVGIQVRLKHSTSDGNSWFRSVSLYEGSVSLPYYHSKDDWSRFPNLLKMRIPNILSAYQYEEGRLHTSPITPSMRASGSMTTTSINCTLKKFNILGESVQNYMTITFTNGGTAAVANYYTAPFVIDADTITASNGRAIQVVNNAVQEVGVARVGAGSEMECYRYTGGNWTLAANQTIHDSTNYPLKYT